MYKWVDERGVVSYSNTPPPATAQPKKVDVVTERVSVYTPDPLLSRAMEEDAKDSREARIARKERSADGTGRAASASAAARSPSAADPAAASRQAAYERCLADRRVECEAIRHGAPPEASYGYTSYYVPHYVIGARVPYAPHAPFYVENRPPQRVGVSTAPPVGISTAPKVGIDDRPPVGAPPPHRTVGRFR